MCRKVLISLFLFKIHAIYSSHDNHPLRGKGIVDLRIRKEKWNLNKHFLQNSKYIFFLLCAILINGILSYQYFSSKEFIVIKLSGLLLTWIMVFSPVSSQSFTPWIISETEYKNIISKNISICLKKENTFSCIVKHRK